MASVVGDSQEGSCIAPGDGWKWWIFYWNFTRKLTGLKRVAPHLGCINESASCECLLSVAKMQRITKTPKVSLRSHLIIRIFHPYKSTSQSFSQPRTGAVFAVKSRVVKLKRRPPKQHVFGNLSRGILVLGITKGSPKMKELWRNQVQPMFNIFVQKMTQGEAKFGRLGFECKTLTFNTSWNWWFPKPDSHLRRYQSRIRVATYFLLANYFSKLPRSPIVLAHAIWK